MRQKSRRDTGSTPVVASSITSSSGVWTRVQASASFCFMPPERRSARRPRNGVMRRRSSSSPRPRAPPQRRHAQAVQQLVSPRLPVVDAMDGGEEGDVLVDREIAVEREALGQVADPAAEVDASRDGVEAAGAHGAAVRRQQPEDDPQGGRLAGAVRADQAEHLAARHPEGDVVDRHEVAVAPDQPLDCYHLVFIAACRLAALGSGGGHGAPPALVGDPSEAPAFAGGPSGAPALAGAWNLAVAGMPGLKRPSRLSRPTFTLKTSFTRSSRVWTFFGVNSASGEM